MIAETASVASGAVKQSSGGASASFSRMLDQPCAVSATTTSEVAPKGVAGVSAAGTAQPSQTAVGQSQAVAGPGSIEPKALIVQSVEQVTAAQTRLDGLMQQARSGKSFSPSQLLGMQLEVYQTTQTLDFAGKVTEKATSGVKQVLQTQV